MRCSFAVDCFFWVVVFLLSGCQEAIVPEQTALANDESDVASESTVDTPTSESESQEPPQKSVGSDSNTAGSIGTAKSKERSATEEMIPEEARELVDAAMKKINPLLHGLRDSGRLDWKMGELDDDVVVLDYKQEQFLLQTIAAVQSYAEKLIQFRGYVWHRIHGIPEVFLDDIMLAKLEKGEFVHPGLRTAAATDFFDKGPSDFTSFWGAEVLDDLENRHRHPLSQMRQRLLAKNVRRSDLFFLLAVYRIGTDDYARILEEEAAIDTVIGLIDLRSLCSDDVSHTTVSYNAPNGRPVERETRGHLYLPRLHQEDFLKEFGARSDAKDPPAPPEPKPKPGALNRKNDPEYQAEQAKLAAEKAAEQAVARKRAENFSTILSSPKQRDDLRNERAALDKRMAILLELLGDEWAEFDFPEPTFSSVDTYYNTRMLMEELDVQRQPKDIAAFRDYLVRLKAAKSQKESMEIAEELFSPDVAEDILKVVTELSDSEYQRITESAPAEFQLTLLPEQLQRIFRALSATAQDEFFAKPLPENIERGIRAASEGEHLAAEGQHKEALQKFEEALAAMDWSEERKQRWARYCRKNGYPTEAEKFWKGNAEQ